MMVRKLFELDKNGVVLFIGDNSHFAFKQFELAKKFELQFSNDTHKIISEIKRKPPNLIISAFTSSNGDIFDIITALNKTKTTIPIVLFLQRSLLSSCIKEAITIVPTDISPKDLLNVVETSLRCNPIMPSVSEYTSLICALNISKEIRIYTSDGDQHVGRLIIRDGIITFVETTTEAGLGALQSLLSQQYVQIHFSETEPSSISNLPAYWTDRFFPKRTDNTNTADYSQFFPKATSQMNSRQLLVVGNEETFSEDRTENIGTTPSTVDVFTANKEPTMLMESSVEALMEISLASILRREYPKAIHALSTVLELDPSNSVARANLEQIKNTLIE